MPDAEGTVISATSVTKGLKAVAAKDDITAIRIKSSRMLMAYGFLRQVFEIFERHQTAIDMITTSEVAISLTIDDDVNLNEIRNELEALGTVEIDRHQTIVSVVGNHIDESPQLLTALFETLRGIQVRMVSFGGSKNNISLLINGMDKPAVLQAINKGLFQM